MRSTRMRRTDELVRDVISELLLTKIQDPRIGLVSVTEVRVSPEFDTAKVYVSVLGDEGRREQTLRGLRSAAGFLQAEVAKAVRLRRTPKLRFLYDDSMERGFRMDATLRSLEGPDAGAAGEREGPPGDGGDEARDR